MILIAAAPFVAHFYDAPELETVLQILAVNFVITGLSNINTIARQKELEFRRLTYMNQMSTLVGTIVTIGLAWWLRSVWALVFGLMVQVAVNSCLSYFFIAGRPRFSFNRGVARDLLGYGKFITASAIVTFIITELDSAVIGKLLGTQQLGFYALAATVATMATLSMSQIASSVLMPAYSKLQGDAPRLHAAYLRVLGLVTLVIAPASAGLACLAEPLLHVVYGEKWLPAAVPLQLLALVGIPRALLITNGYFFEGIGKPNVALHLGLLRLAIIGPLVVPMVKAHGLAGAATTVAIGGTVQWLAGLFYLRRYAGVRVGEVAKAIWRPLWTSLAMSAAVFGITILVDPRSSIGLASAVLIGIVAYLALNVNVLRDLMARRF
jgi:PST family polysaccharide transporter/lipopolysaccharide exporter